MQTMKLVGAVLVAAVLAGCGAAPSAPKATGEGETRVSTKKLNAAKGKASAPAATATPTPRPTAYAPAPQASASAAVAAEETEAEDPVLELVSGPATGVRVVPFRTPDGQALDVLCEPEDGLARFQIQAPAAGVVITKAQIELGGVEKPASLELTREELEWPAKIAGEATLPVPVRLYETLKVLSENKDANRFTLKVTLIGSDGAPLTQKDGEPLVLQTSVSVL